MREQGEEKALHTPPQANGGRDKGRGRGESKAGKQQEGREGSDVDEGQKGRGDLQVTKERGGSIGGDGVEGRDERREGEREGEG